MQHRHKQQGMILGVLAMLFAIGVASVLASEFARNSLSLHRDRISDDALAKAREALIGYAAGRPIDNVVGPGYLPCPDLDDDGWAESTCGSQSGEIGQQERLGRLPWKTLGIGDLRDGYGERLWYAVSSKYKGLLNCTLSPDCLDMSPDTALGTITVRDSTGSIVHDGRSTNLYAPVSGGAVAVIIAPGAALMRGPQLQDRSCRGGECNSAGHCTTKPYALTPKCNPANYLDRATANGIEEDNASFTDRNDTAGRHLNVDGFVRGPVRTATGEVIVNDRVAVISYDDIMPRIMQRVAQEVALCLREYASQPLNRGRYPWPAPACHQGSPDRQIEWSGSANALFGRVPAAPFRSTRTSSDGEMLEDWAGACSIAGSTGLGWWTWWRWHVFYAVSYARRPRGGPVQACGDAASCLQVQDETGQVFASGKEFAVLVAGTPTGTGAFVQSHSLGSVADVRQWLEGSNAELQRMNPSPASSACAPEPPLAPCTPLSSCNRVTMVRSRGSNDVALAWP